MAKNLRFPAPRAAACSVHDLLLQKVTGPRFAILNGGARNNFDPENMHGQWDKEVTSLAPPHSLHIFY
jgi:hypothetical protein